MTQTRDIYLLNPKTLSPEVIAVAFAKTSRSPDSFRDIAAGLTDEQSAAFHEKWVVGYGHACYDERTEVLTEDGWRPWCEVAEDWHSKRAESIRLATLNPETGFLEYLTPVRIIAQPYQGLMYRVLAKAVDLCVTPNHRMWVCSTRTKQGRRKQNFQLFPAYELGGVPCVYQLSARWNGPEPETLRVGNREVNACALMKLTGFFIGDGYHDRRYHSAVSFNIRKNREIVFLQRVVDECGFSWSLHGRKHYVTGLGLGDFLEQCYDDQRRKMIPRTILQFGPRLLQSLMEGLLNSDGNVDSGNHVLYCTTSEPLKDQLYEVALKLGWAAYAVKREEQRSERQSHKPTYTIHFNRTRLKPEVNKVSYRKQDGWEIYEGIVYCAEMPRNHTLYVRRNGRPVWSGNSVAEHAVLHIAIENVSRLAVECIESNRLASYTEKSTRYQVFDRDGYFTPPNVAASKHADLYRGTIRMLFDAYFDSIEPARQVIRAQHPRKEGESEKRHEGRIRSKWIDNCRFLLPAATLANVGMTANARVLEHAIAKMLSHALEEVRDIGAEVKRVALAEVPTLVKYADRSSYLAGLEVGGAMSRASNVQPPTSHLQSPISNHEAVTLIDYDRDAEAKFVAACLYRTGGRSFAEALARAGAMNAEERARVIDTALGGRGDFDIPLRELEHVTYTFDCVMDNGAYFDVKRHRMMTQTPQPLTVDLGYAIPRVIEQAGLRDGYCRALDQSIEAYCIIARDFPHEASYLVANAFNRRVLMTLNLRELFHFCRLRGAPNGHFSYRRIAVRMYEMIREVHPAFARYMRCEQYPSSEQIEKEFFAQA